MADQTIHLPRNIRQIGTPGELQKVYVEDYVHTYLHSFLKEKYKEDTLRAAALFGDCKSVDDRTYAFVKGAIACDFSQVHDSMSSQLSKQAQEYFPGWDMLGWYVGAQGVDGHIQSEIKHYYAGTDRTLPGYLIYEDELEKETDVFVWEQNSLHKLTGYYIYYEKNPRMQEFLIREKGGRPQETPTYRPAPTTQELSSYIYKEETETKQVEKPDKRIYRPQKLVYAACAVVLVLLAAMGVSQIGNYHNLQQLQEAVSNAVIHSEDQTQVEETPNDEPPLQEQEEDPDTEAMSQEQEEEPDAEAVSQEQDAPVSESITTDQDLEEVAPVVQQPERPDSYTVKKGDSLFSISRAVYENEDMVDQICELNGITNVNLIYEGQNLKLP